VARSAGKDSSNGLPERQVQAIARVLSDPRRFEILKSIAAHECTACMDLREAFPITAPTLSHHLKELESAGLIAVVRRGKFMDLEFQRDIWDAYVAELGKV
jgi:ArsR family transcriptional regulator, arsenate/arsenite/antimonite-responsive transcriptional repressor